MSVIFTAEPEAIFLPKFENATPASREAYATVDAGRDCIFVAAVKSSGSLWIASSRDGTLVETSKNGSNNVYSSAGHYALLCKLQEEFNSGWRAKYHELLAWLEENSVSLGCELVTKCLGDHAAVPNRDHLVVNAVLDRASMQPCSPLVLLELRRRFRLLIPGMFMFETSADFLAVFDRFQWDAAATWSEVSAAMRSAAWRTVHMPYKDLHSEILEGFVCSMVPRSAAIMEWAKSEGLSEAMAVDGDSAKESPLDRAEGLMSVSELCQVCRGSLDALHAEMCKRMEALGVRFRTPQSVRMDEVFEQMRSVMPEGDGEGAGLFRGMVDALSRLAIPHAFKCWRDGDSYLVCVHILQDWGFARYEKDRASRGAAEGLLIPPLLRGNTWRLTFTKVGPAHREIMAGDVMEESPRPAKKRATGAPALRWDHAQGTQARGPLAGGGALPDSTWKFKLLSYTHRTFLMRNCGTTLAKTGNLSNFQKDVERFLRTWGVPPEVSVVMSRRARAWGRFVVALAEEEDRKALAQGAYLSTLTRFEATPEFRLAHEGGADSEEWCGLLFVVSPHAQCVRVAQRAAMRIAGGVGVRASNDNLDAVQLRSMAESGGVIFGNVTDAGTLKVLRGMEKLPTRGVHVIIALLDVTEEGACFALEANASEGAYKRAKGMTMGFLSRLPPSQGGVSVCVVSRGAGEGVEQFVAEASLDASFETLMRELQRGPGHEGGAGPPGAGAEDAGLRDRRGEEVSMPPVYVVMFVTMVGWGKNAVCEILQRQAATLCESLGIAGGGLCEILEGDALRGNIWPEAARAIANPSLRLLILNRNFPPNSWVPSLKHLQAASERRRAVVPIAVIPQSAGTHRSPFTLCDFAVCLAGVQGRTNHGTGLDASSRKAASVAAMFCNMYSGMGGWHSLVERVRSDLTPNVAVVPWLADGCNDNMPPDLIIGMQKVLSSSEADEDASRACIAAHRVWISACRIPAEEVAASLRDAVHRAVIGAEVAGGTCTGVQRAGGGVLMRREVKYISVVLDDGEGFARSVMAALPPGRQQAEVRKGYHVTVWHAQAHGATPPDWLLAMDGASVEVRARLVAADDACVCAAVLLGEPCAEACFNKVPHVTLWTKEGVLNKYSNELLARAPFHAGLPGGEVIVGAKPGGGGGGYFASLLNEEEESSIPVHRGVVTLHV